jgi:predicted Fe-S protein YdhL (DUF1289 family)
MAEGEVVGTAKCQGCRRKPRKGDEPHAWAIKHAQETGHVTIHDETEEVRARAEAAGTQFKKALGYGEKECVTQQIARILQRQGAWDPSKYEVYPPMEL